MKKYILFLFCALTLLASCGSLKKTPKGEREDDTVSIKKAREELTRYSAVMNKSFMFDLFQSKIRYQYGDKSLNGKFYVESGKRLCLTVNVLGIEMARIEVDNDNVTIVDKFDKQYTVLSIGDFARQFGMSDEICYDALECILLGRVFVPGSGIATSKDFGKFDWNIYGDTGEMVGVITKDKYNLTYTLDSINNLSSTSVLMMCSVGRGNIGCGYSDVIAFEQGALPTVIALQLDGAGIDVKANMVMSNPVLTTKSWTSFKPTETYSKVSIQELIDTIKKLTDKNQKGK